MPDPGDPLDLRIEGGTVLSMVDGAPPLEDACVEVSGRDIVHVGAPSARPARSTHDARGKLVLPGLVNTHVHLSQQLGRGLADDVDLLTWLRDRIWPYEAMLSSADVEASALACAVEQIRNGVTTIADPGGRHVDAAGDAMTQAGMRAYLGLSLMDQPAGLPEGAAFSTQEALDVQDDLVARWHGAAGGRIRMAYTARTIFNCSDAVIEGGAERARRHGTIMQMHVAEIPAEIEHTRATRGARTVEHLGRLGVLGPRFLAAHVVWVDDDEIELLASSGAAVSHNVASNLRVLGIPRIADMLDAGVLVGIGTDGAPANNRMSLIDEMYMAALVQKGLRLDPTVLPAPRVLAMATREGARAVSWDDEIGSLESGKRADLVIVDPATANMVPVLDPVSATVTAMKSENIEAVMCDGRWLMRDRIIKVLDEQAILSTAQARATDLALRISRGHAAGVGGRREGGSV